MTPRGGAVLYTPEILALAVELSRYPLTNDFAVSGDAHSRVCGSRVSMGMNVDMSGRIVEIGARVSACALGQAAAAVFLRFSKGQNAPALARALDATERWLAGGEQVPDWPGIAALAAARGYPARHPAILLPWKAALAALSNRVVAD